MAFAVGLRFLLDINYIIVIIAFFLIIDIFVFFKRKSLIDILSKVTYVESLSSVVENNKDSNKIMAIKENEVESPIVVEKEQEEVPIQDTNTKKIRKFMFPTIVSNKASIKMASIYIYIIWLAINITALAYAMANPHKTFGRGFELSGHINTSAFYPFESYDIGTYDFSEFVVYIVAVPLCMFAIIKLILMFVPSKTN